MLYLVDYWVPFPSSEYGGILVVRGNSIIDVEKAIRGNKALQQDVVRFPREFLNAIQTATLLNESGEPKVLASFYT